MSSIWGYIFFAIIIAILKTLWGVRFKGRQPIRHFDTEHADTDIIAVPYRGEYITLTYIEYLNVWQGMNRQQKNAILNNQILMLKKGFVWKKLTGNGKEYITEATAIGKKFSDIHQKKNELYVNGK